MVKHESTLQNCTKQRNSRNTKEIITSLTTIHINKPCNRKSENNDGRIKCKYQTDNSRNTKEIWYHISNLRG